MTFRVGDEIIVVTTIGRGRGNYFYGNCTSYLPIGTIGKVERVFDTEVRAQMRLGRGYNVWSFHPEEIRLVGESNIEGGKIVLEEEFKMVERVFELKKSKYVSLEEDKSYLRLYLSKDLKELIGLFACEEKTEYSFGIRHRIKNLLAHHHRYCSYFDILFDVDLLKNGVKDFEMDMVVYNDYSNYFEKLEELIEAMLKIIQKENLTIKVQATTDVVSEELNVREG